jgi:hypothetical protein
MYPLQYRVLRCILYVCVCVCVCLCSIAYAVHPSPCTPHGRTSRPAGGPRLRAPVWPGPHRPRTGSPLKALHYSHIIAFIIAIIGSIGSPLKALHYSHIIAFIIAIIGSVGSPLKALHYSHIIAFIIAIIGSIGSPLKALHYSHPRPRTGSPHTTPRPHATPPHHAPPHHAPRLMTAHALPITSSCSATMRRIWPSM